MTWSPELDLPTVERRRWYGQKGQRFLKTIEVEAKVYEAKAKVVGRGAE